MVAFVVDCEFGSVATVGRLTAEISIATVGRLPTGRRDATGGRLISTTLLVATVGRLATRGSCPSSTVRRIKQARTRYGGD